MPNDEIIKLKAEIFDLQVEYARVRTELERKLKELNEIIKKGERPVVGN